MPIPTPHAGESQDDFVSRCSSALADEYPDEKQRAAICYGAWRDRDKAVAPRRTIKAGQTIYKAFGDTEVRAEGGDSRRVTFTITTDAVDRDRDVIHAAGWKLDAYRKNPVVLFAHDYKSLPIARAVDIRQTEHGISATAEFMTADINPM